MVTSLKWNNAFLPTPSWFFLCPFLTCFTPHYFSQTPPTLGRLWLLHPFLSSLRCLSAFSVRIPPLSQPLNHLVSRSRKTQPSTWLLNLSVSNSAQWPFSLGLGSQGLWVRGNALRILFRKRGIKKKMENKNFYCKNFWSSELWPLICILRWTVRASATKIRSGCVLHPRFLWHYVCVTFRAWSVLCSCCCF